MDYRALIFDFDGLVLNTEVPEFEAWTEVYRRHGATLRLDDWVKIIGTTSEAFNVIDNLISQVDEKVDISNIRSEHHSIIWSLLQKETVMPGVERLIQQGKAAGMRIAIASSSPLEWVAGHLSRLGIKDWFETICTSEDVAMVKPDPALFLCAAKRLTVEPAQAIVFEDSLHGVTAAKRAGMRCVAVPHIITRGLDLSSADLIINSLDDIELNEILSRLNGKI